ncbi:hypothetical protein [Spirosoma validum]|uniref:Uncharacterized protein n=1 Tax=Spirosoma validum TaxID=2771355 RepID=A0A927GGB9_9BACT|nr:hypothetical protein [Spirosoma validum]MBD2756548.1 hypothetical protein [Spirosoma validum]
MNTKTLLFKSYIWALIALLMLSPYSCTMMDHPCAAEAAALAAAQTAVANAEQAETNAKRARDIANDAYNIAMGLEDLAILALSGCLATTPLGCALLAAAVVAAHFNTQNAKDALDLQQSLYNQAIQATNQARSTRLAASNALAACLAAHPNAAISPQTQSITADVLLKKDFFEKELVRIETLQKNISSNYKNTEDWLSICKKNGQDITTASSALEDVQSRMNAMNKQHDDIQRDYKVVLEQVKSSKDQ